MTRTPSISVVIPLYNKSGSVLETVASAANQADVDFEIVVVDDGSTDGSAELVSAAHVRNLRLIKQANAGVSAARNNGIRVAKGKWIAFLDADDQWSRDHLAGLFQATADNEVIAVFSNLRLQSKSDRLLIDPAVLPSRIDNYFSFALSHGYPISSSSVLVLRDQLFGAGLFDQEARSGEDIDMWCRLACRGCFFYNAKPSATYNDVGSATLRAGTGEVSPPIFAQRLSKLMRDGSVPTALAESARRYANFLMLEYARQLLDCGRYQQARAVLLGDCVAGYDAKRFLKRLARTSLLGRALFQLTREGAVSLLFQAIGASVAGHRHIS